MTDLIKLTVRCADGSVQTRLATSAQDVGNIEAQYLALIPGAVFCLRSTLEKNIERTRAFWVYQAQTLDFTAPIVAKRGLKDRPPGRYA